MREVNSKIWVPLAVFYGALYLSRYSISSLSPILSNTLGWGGEDLGEVLAFGFAGYGLGMAFLGSVLDSRNAVSSLRIGLIGSGVFTAFGALCNAEQMKWVWAAQCLFQSIAALVIPRITERSYPQDRRGIISGFFGAVVQVGRVAALLLPLLATGKNAVLISFSISGGVLVALGLLSPFFLKGLPSMAQRPQSPVFLVRDPVFLRMAIIQICLGAGRHGFEQWAPRIAFQKFDSLMITPILALVSLLGGLSAGGISDKIFRGIRVPVGALGIFIMGLGAAIAAWGSWTIGLLMMSFGLSIAHLMFTVLLSMDFGGKQSTATWTGTLHAFQYVGGAISSLWIGRFLIHGNETGWAVFIFFVVFVALLISMRIWNIKKTAV